MIKEQYKYFELTGKILGASMEVHKISGNGFQEVIYQRALDKEMRLQNIIFDREFEMPIFFRGEQIGTRRVDFLVEGLISVELKALAKIEDVHLAQAINYLEAYNTRNRIANKFRHKRLEFKRLINSEFNKSPLLNS
ncbi:MAG TPA: GxxExxY protein [Cytophaga sp.]|jgi:GxxExxY protein|nr:GxxExxY protein [Cytophaga sp.]